MTHPVDRAAEIIAQEWGTFSSRDLCGHEISLARALHRAGMLNTDADHEHLDPHTLDLARDFADEYRNRWYPPGMFPSVDRTAAAARVLHALIGAPDSDDPPTINDESLTEVP